MCSITVLPYVNHFHLFEKFILLYIWHENFWLAFVWVKIITPAHEMITFRKYNLLFKIIIQQQI
jgi:hypothetical protein